MRAGNSATALVLFASFSAHSRPRCQIPIFSGIDGKTQQNRTSVRRRSVRPLADSPDSLIHTGRYIFTSGNAGRVACDKWRVNSRRNSGFACVVAVHNSFSGQIAAAPLQVLDAASLKCLGKLRQLFSREPGGGGADTCIGVFAAGLPRYLLFLCLLERE